MAIRKSKINIDTEERSDFDNMLNDVENEVEEQQAEDGLVNRVPELKQLSEDIDKATNTFINAALELELLLLYNKVQISSVYPQFASSDSIRCKRLWRYATLFCNSCFR